MEAVGREQRSARLLAVRFPALGRNHFAKLRSRLAREHHAGVLARGSARLGDRHLRRRPGLLLAQAAVEEPDRPRDGALRDQRPCPGGDVGHDPLRPPVVIKTVVIKTVVISRRSR